MRWRYAPFYNKAAEGGYLFRASPHGEAVAKRLVRWFSSQQTWRAHTQVRPYHV